MAFDIADKPYSDAGIIRSVYNLNDNALSVKVVDGADAVTGPVAFVRYDYTVPVTTAAYTQIVASTAVATKSLQLFDSSGKVLVVAFGAAASEVDQFYIMPGGNGNVPCEIPAGTRISIKAVDANATSGQLVINFYA